ncbi:MAG: hypothetical protein OXC97_00320 [Candidatus Dadabacteria bacterium]|nr:hypothetical protein [Candidatus Dadabacteria bacterium]
MISSAGLISNGQDFAVIERGNTAGFLFSLPEAALGYVLLVFQTKTIFIHALVWNRLKRKIF